MSQLASEGHDQYSRQQPDSSDTMGSNLNNQNKNQHTNKSDFQRKISPMGGSRGAAGGERAESRGARTDKVNKIVDPKQIAQAPLIIQPQNIDRLQFLND